ncbi:MAG: alcohol dehydrogenase catalytic domain-containing protein [Actinobacteria bacterium]|nr:alcohol dehydrogenase catalytic domain-containing protein [Cyanobacteriota bacterium]MCL5770819.1 alcohol dehydrogenase catalytic domain-containing protein [Actinomycetota bacterium]
MLAVVYQGKGLIKVEDIPIPKIKSDEILLKVKTTSICATDLKIKEFGHFKNPLDKKIILGHEVAGEIAEVGSNIKQFKVGMRLSMAPNIGCGVCDQCVSGQSNYCEDYSAIGINLNGSFAEYMVIPEEYIRQGNIYLLQDNVSFEEASLAEPLSTVFCASEAVEIGPKDIVLIMGAGPMGILHVMMAKLRGAQKIIVSEISKIRSEQALKFGADLVINPQNENLKEFILANSYGRGADVIIITAPSKKAQEDSLDLVAIQGRILFFGGLPKGQDIINFKSNIIHYKHIIVTGTTGQSILQYRKSVELIAAKKIDLKKLISIRYSLSEAEEAFKNAKLENVLKVMFNV